MKTINRLQNFLAASKLVVGSLFLIVVSVSATTQLVSAATAQPKGTCFVNSPGKPSALVTSCKSAGVTTSQKDTDGKAVSYSNCYEVNTSTSTETITHVNCDDTPIAGTTPPAQMCTPSGGGAAVACATCSDGSQAAPGDCPSGATQNSTGKYHCGEGSDAVTTSIDLGCQGKGNPILDLTFAIVRFLSTGVGIVLVGSMIWAGIQYTSSRGDPNATAQAINRIRSNVIALLLFIFAYAILNYLIPGQFLK